MDTEYGAVVTRLRSAWDDQDLRDRHRGGYGKTGRTVHFADADREWYSEQISRCISGEGAEVDASWFYDPTEAIRWCGVLGPNDFGTRGG